MRLLRNYYVIIIAFALFTVAAFFGFKHIRQNQHKYGQATKPKSAIERVAKRTKQAVKRKAKSSSKSIKKKFN